MVHCFGCISASVAAEQDLWTHHAIGCVTGTCDAIILDRMLGKEGNTIGYTSWGNLIFTPENLGVGPVDATHKQSPTKLLLHVALPTCFV